MTLQEEIVKLEDEIREEAFKLSNIFKGYPSTEEQFSFFHKQIRALELKLELRVGKKAIEATS